MNRQNHHPDRGNGWRWADLVPCLAPTVRAFDLGDLPDTERLLRRAHQAAAPGRLPGTIDITVADDLSSPGFVDRLLFIAQRHGRVDLCWANGRIVGVACWIRHSTGTPSVAPLPSAGLATPGTPAWEIATQLGRLDLLDQAFDVPANTVHLHLACLGTEPCHGYPMIADRLLRHQNQLADRDGLTLHTEIPTQTDLGWLHRSGYTDCGLFLAHEFDTPSRVMVRAPNPGRAAESDRGPPQPLPIVLAAAAVRRTVPFSPPRDRRKEHPFHDLHPDSTGRQASLARRGDNRDRRRRRARLGPAAGTHRVSAGRHDRRPRLRTSRTSVTPMR